MSETMLYLKTNKSALAASGHPWVFDGALNVAGGEASEPCVARLHTADDKFVAVGTYNPKSPIAFRVLSRKAVSMDTAFFIRRFEAALALRRRVLDRETDGFRLVNSEGDRLPGLTIDSFGNHLAVQVGTPGMDLLAPAWIPALHQVFSPLSITRKDSQSVANREHMTSVQAVLAGEPPEVISFKEAGVSFCASVLPGQKTGFFFDQRDNRVRIAALSVGMRILDGYAYTGGFGAHTLARGAALVTGVDSSAPACEMMETNYRLNANNPARFEVVRQDCVQFLKQTDRTFDIVLLDPPALAKRRHHLPQAVRLYREIFESGMRRVARDGGYLLASSCSAAVDTTSLIEILRQATSGAGRHAQILHVGGAGPDHPVSLHHPEGEYLKSALIRIF